jgi:hypothetical protein
MKTLLDQALFVHRLEKIADKFHAGEIGYEEARAEMAKLKKNYQPVCFRLEQETDNHYYLQCQVSEIA